MQRVRIKAKRELTPKCMQVITWLKYEHPNLPKHADVYVLDDKQSREFALIDMLFSELTRAPRGNKGLYVKLLLNSLLSDNAEMQLMFKQEITKHTVLTETINTETDPSEYRPKPHNKGLQLRFNR